MGFIVMNLILGLFFYYGVSTNDLQMHRYRQKVAKAKSSDATQTVLDNKRECAVLCSQHPISSDNNINTNAYCEGFTIMNNMCIMYGPGDQIPHENTQGTTPRYLEIERKGQESLEAITTSSYRVIENKDLISSTEAVASSTTTKSHTRETNDIIPFTKSGISSPKTASNITKRKDVLHSTKPSYHGKETRETGLHTSERNIKETHDTSSLNPRNTLATQATSTSQFDEDYTSTNIPVTKVAENILTETSKPENKLFDESCSTYRQCSFQHGDCLQKRCKCRIGYSFDYQSGRCVEKCSEYGNLFTTHKFSSVGLCNVQRVFVKTNWHTECMDACVNAEFVCISCEIKFTLIGQSLCNLCNQTWFETKKENRFYKKSQLFTLFNRDCKQ